ncbi:NAD(P)/FAD-dependent oxidoreductase [Nocardia sp. BMG51109]|uniref:NAD(P)/FAD-dependent oxidoreductase n=1 Tax=Nocardia sp. BMG51109 TaxID=1056816 RepID=UPI0004ACF904|nr:NAD(P)/FAD-dependent oxidoreductase [Nocardia sp. BMG51109]
MERTRTMLPQRLSAGIVAAVPAAAAVRVLATVPGGGAEAPPWGAWIGHAVLFGAVLGLLAGGRKHSAGSAMAVGLLLGLADWLFWRLTLSVLVSGRVPKWTLPEAVSAFDDLVPVALLGAVAGPLMYGLTGLWRRRAAQTAPRAPHIVVVGGGFGGVGAARRLETLVARGLRAEVTVISESNFLLFTPLLVGVASSTLEPRHITAPVRTALRYASFLHGRVESVDPARRELVVAAGSRDRQRVPYDELIVAVGAVPRFFDLPGLAEHAFAMKSIDDANRLRNHVLAALEQADLETDAAEQVRLLTFVVAGGGFAGTELIAELYDLVHGVLHYYPRLHDAEPRFVLVHSGDRLLPELPADLGDYALRTLGGRGIEFRLGTRVVGAGPGSVRFSDEAEIETHTFAWTAGNWPNPLVERIGQPGAAGPLQVDECLRVTGVDGVWALGDCARIPDPKNPGSYYPPTAQHAIREGKAVADNVAAVLGGRSPAPFRFGALGVLVSLGHRTAAGQVFGRRVSGLIGWMLWRAVYLGKLPGAEKRLRVAADWLLDLVFSRDIALTSTAIITTTASDKDRHV